MEEKFIKTSRMQLNENWVYRDKSRLQEGYYAYTSISFQTTDYSNYVDHWKKLTKFKNLTIGSVYWDVSNRIELRNQTRIEALKAAKAKAEVMAETMDVILVEPLIIEEREQSRYSSSGVLGNFVGEVESDSSGEEAVSPGQEVISVRVEVVFRIAKK